MVNMHVFKKINLLKINKAIIIKFFFFLLHTYTVIPYTHILGQGVEKHFNKVKDEYV